jgi:hypothetical protein
MQLLLDNPSLVLTHICVDGHTISTQGTLTMSKKASKRSRALVRPPTISYARLIKKFVHLECKFGLLYFVKWNKVLTKPRFAAADPTPEDFAGGPHVKGIRTITICPAFTTEPTTKRTLDEKDYCKNKESKKLKDFETGGMFPHLSTTLTPFHSCRAQTQEQRNLLADLRPLNKPQATPSSTKSPISTPSASLLAIPRKPSHLRTASPSSSIMER